MSERFRACSDIYYCDENMTPEQNLAAAILRRAVMDARRVNAGKMTDGLYKSNYSKHELLKFFNSRWCDSLIGSAELTGRDLQKAVGW